MENSLQNQDDYLHLVQHLKTLLSSSKAKALEILDKLRTETYWQMGEALQQTFVKEIFTNKKDLFVQLEDDLSLSAKIIAKIHQFYLAWPDGVPAFGKNFTWSHHLELLPVKNKKSRERYLRLALDENLTRDQLRQKILQDRNATLQNSSTQNTSLTRRKNLHAYKAFVTKIVDGDTIDVQLELGFDVLTNQRLRLRGINVVEADEDLKKFEKALEFVQKELSKAEFVVVQTHKTDIYGRFVADVFYHPTLKDKNKVFEDGYFLNQKLLDKRLAEIY